MNGFVSFAISPHVLQQSIIDYTDSTIKQKHEDYFLPDLPVSFILWNLHL